MYYFFKKCFESFILAFILSFYWKKQEDYKQKKQGNRKISLFTVHVRRVVGRFSTGLLS